MCHLKPDSFVVKLDQSNVELLGDVIEVLVHLELEDRFVKVWQRFRAGPHMKLSQPEPELVPGFSLDWRLR